MRFTSSSCAGSWGLATNLLVFSRRKWRRQGAYVEGTESIVRLPGGITKRRDLHGFADLKVMFPDREIYVQVTSWANVSHRLRKIQKESVGSGQWRVLICALVRLLLGYGAEVLIEGWRLKNGRWESRERWVTVEDLEEGDNGRDG